MDLESTTDKFHLEKVDSTKSLNIMNKNCSCAKWKKK